MHSPFVALAERSDSAMRPSCRMKPTRAGLTEPVAKPEAACLRQLLPQGSEQHQDFGAAEWSEAERGTRHMP